jgi:hypothetical protein
MKRNVFLVGAIALCLSLTGAGALRILLAGPPQFDRLTDEDRRAFGERFEKEIWPLLTRNGKDGCVGCHTSKIVTALRYTGDPKKDYLMLLKEGFFLHGDDGSLAARVQDKDPDRRMPKGKTPWAQKDVRILEQFTADLHKKQRK